jgi:hypothetical protein
VRFHIAGVKCDIASVNFDIAGVKLYVVNVKCGIAGVSFDIAYILWWIADVRCEIAGMNFGFAGADFVFAGERFDKAIKILCVPKNFGHVHVICGYNPRARLTLTSPRRVRCLQRLARR